MAQNLVEKIVQGHAVGARSPVRSGDVVDVRPAHVLTHDNTSSVIAKFRALGATRVHDPRQPVFAIDHDVQNRSDANLDKYARIEAFAREHGIAWYPPGRGIAHQVLCEEGFVVPGTLVVASDSHANLYGGLGALGTPVVRTDAAALWATGTTWLRVPPVTRCVLTGALRPGVSGKDVILTLCGRVAGDEVLGHAVELCGPGVATLSIDERLTIANMTTEWGALAGVFPCDARTLEWLASRLDVLARRAGSPGRGSLTAARLDALRAATPAADEGAGYARTIHVDLALVEPSVTGPNDVKRLAPLSEVRARRVRIDKAYLVSCVNGRADDFTEAAEAMGGRPVAPAVELYIAAASSEVETESRRRGDWQRLLDAGARPLPPGCGPCIGLGAGLLEDGEVGISATNRNFRGRMGSRDTEAYLASPAVVAASAAAGHVTGPWAEETAGDAVRLEPAGPEPASSSAALRDGFPSLVEGEVLFVDADDLDTDGIYSKDWTYRDDVPPGRMAAVAMENYDPRFQAEARAGDILVAGSNFGAGSSREQAATCLVHRGIRAVVAASFSETYRRNAFNNGFLCLECPSLVRDLRARFADRPRAATRRAGLRLALDLARGVARAGGVEHPVEPLGLAAQDLILAGGLENRVRAALRG